MKILHWGIIGTGDVTEVKNGPGLYKLAHSELTAVYNRTYSKAADYAERHGVQQVYRTPEELLADHVIDAVYVATPPKFHKAYALQVLEAGKVPYIEKPLAMSYEEALEIQALAEAKGLPVYVAFYRRGLEKFIRIKELLEEGIIGDVRLVKVTQTAPLAQQYQDRDRLPWRVIPEISGGGLFMDVGSHVLDCLQMFFGEFETMTGSAANTGGCYDAEDTVVASFRFRNGICGTGSWCFAADRQHNEVVIIGEKGRIVYDPLSVKNFTVTVEGKETTYTYEQPDHIGMPYEKEIVEELLDLGKSHADFGQAVNLVEMMMGVLGPYYDCYKKTKGRGKEHC